MSTVLLRSVIQEMLSEMYRRSRKSDSRSWIERLELSKPRSVMRGELMNDLLVAVNSRDDKDMRVMLRTFFPVIARFAGVTSTLLDDYEASKSEWYAWIDAHKQEMDLPPRQWSAGGLALRDRSGKLSTQIWNVLSSANFKGVHKHFKEWIADNQVDWRPDVTIPEDYYAL